MNKLKKVFTVIITIFLIIIFIHPVLAGITSITKEDVPAATLYPYDTNKLVFKINLSGTGTDVLNSIEFSNGGTALQPVDISSLKLWYQATGGEFNPGTATFICEIPGTGSSSWEKTAINFTVAAGSSLYITVDISSTPVNNRTIKMTLLKNGLSIGSNTYPDKNQTNANTQTISNPPKLLVSFLDFLPAKINRGHENILAARYFFYNSGTTGVSITNIILRTINYSGEINADTAITRIILKSGTTTYADITAIPSLPQISITLSPQITIPGLGESFLDVYIYLRSDINTRDIGLRLAAGSDITTQQVITKEAKSGFSFPMDTKLSVITLPISSVNVSSDNLLTPFTTVSQPDVKTLLLNFSHPESVTTYADISIRAVTLTAGSETTPSLIRSDLFSRIKIYDSVTTYADIVPASLTNQVLIPFTNYAVISAGISKSVTISVDLKSGIFDNNFYASISQSANIGAYDDSAGSLISVNGTFPMGSNLSMIQRLPSSLNIYHTNKMPSVVIANQKFVYAEDFILTHPNSGNYASIQVKGITLNVEDNLGNTIVPFSVISKVTILDSNNNTIISHSSIPLDGYKIYLNFSSPVILSPTASSTLKVYIDIPESPAGSYVKLNLNSSLNVNAVDGNSGTIPVSVQATGGDLFPMKTSAAQILNAATDVKVKHTDTMPSSANEGQENIIPMTLNFLNDSGGIVSIEKINFRFYDNLNNSISANSVISNIKVDNFNNTSLVYADTAVTTDTAYFDLTFSSPVLINYGMANSVTVNVRVKIAEPALTNNFKMSIISEISITAKDYSSGNTINVIANADTFPMSSSIINIEKRANTLNVSHDGTNSGSAQKGDADVHVMDLIFENPGLPGACDIVITGITLTVENATGNTISAATVFSKVKIENKNTLLTYGEINSIPSKEYLYFSLATPITVPAGASNNITCSVKANIAPFATANSFVLNLKQGGWIRAFDKNQGLYVTVTAKPPDSFEMRSNTINIVSANKMTVLHINTMPETVSNGQQGIKPFILRFANASDNPCAVRGVTFTVEDITNSGIIPDILINKVYLIDSSGNTNIVLTTIPDTGDKIYLDFTQDVTISASSYKDVSVFVDLKENTFVANFQLNLSSSSYIYALPVTLTVEADSTDAFPMRSGNALIQIKPVMGGISHSDVIPTTVSTGQSNIFAEILHIANYNVTGSADIQLTGITITVEDDTNTVIDPTDALKKIMIRDESKIYAFFSGIPSAPSSFYVPFIEPAVLSVSETADLKLYIDIVDTINTGNFQINIKIDADVTFRDKNTGLTITAQAINGDSFPMRTSVVIIQEKASLCRVKTQDLMPYAVNKGQQNITTMKLSFSNEGSANGANILITRMILNIEGSSDAGIIPKTAISRLYIKDAAGIIYGDVLTIPDYGDSVTIALTTPITVQVGERKEVYAIVNINPDAIAPDFKINLKSASGIIARDGNSYDIINVSADPGYSFPMKTSAALIQNISQTLNIAHYSIITPTVNKGDSNVAAIYFEFINPNPYGYSDIIVNGLTITVEDEEGAGIIPSSAINKLKLEGVSLYGEQSIIPSYGSSVYVPLTITPLSIAPSSYIGATLFADISLTTNQLYLQFTLKQGTDCLSQDKNSGEKINTINAKAGDSFPMYSGVTTIVNPPGITVSYLDIAPYSVTEGQGGINFLKFKFTNIGSFAENINGLTLTVKDFASNNADAELIINNAYLVDDAGNTFNSSVFKNGASLYLDMTAMPFTVNPQNYKEAYVYIDLKDTTFNANFFVSLETDSDVLTSSPVSAETSYTFPMTTHIITLQEKTADISMSMIDWMPPNVSTGQKDVFVFVLNFENNEPFGYSPVVIYGITFTVKDSVSNTIPANTAISRLVITDLAVDYLNTDDINSGDLLAFDFSVPLTITAGTSKSVYCIVDITGNTLTFADNFKLSIDSGLKIMGRDYNSGSYVTVNAKSGFVFPMESSAAFIQKKASILEVSHIDEMPSYVSTDQENVSAMNLILTNSGDAETSSIMVTRINFYIQNPADANINPLNVIKSLSVTSKDGFTVYGANTTLSSSKIIVNLTAPIIVSTAAPVTIKVNVGITNTYLNNEFKVSLDTNTDIYALDANSFELVNVVNKTPDVFPMKSGLTYIKEKVSNIILDSFTSLLTPAVTKGDKGVKLFTFRIEDALNTLTAKAEFQAITITVKNSAGNDISANSVIEKLYIIDGTGNTIGFNTTGVSNKIPVKFPSVYSISPQSVHYITVCADILGTASASDFKVLLESNDVSIKDENSKLEVAKTISPAMPWETGVAGVYNAPATELHVWHGNYAPTQVGSGQTDVRFMSLSFYNPGGSGTSDVIAKGVTITVVDASGTTLAPADIIRYIRISDFAEIMGYGWVTTTSYTLPEPFYIDFTKPVEADASNTVTVYVVADISSSTILANFKLRITSPDDINAHNYPAGAVTISAQNSDSFPLASVTVSKIATTYILRVTHTNLMPLTIAKGDKDIKSLKLNFENKDAGQYIDITGLSLTVKDKSGNGLKADKVLDALKIEDVSGNTLFGSAVITSSEKVFIPVSAFKVEKLSEKEMIIKIDIKEDAAESFYIELESENDLITSPACTIQAGTGDYFGNMKTNFVSIQEASLEKSFHNFPNPFNPDKVETKITYYLENDADVTIKILTLDGRLVKEIIKDKFKTKGLHYEDTWNGLNEVKAKVKSGVYLCVIEVKYKHGEVKKLIKKIAVLR